MADYTGGEEFTRGKNVGERFSMDGRTYAVVDPNKGIYDRYMDDTWKGYGGNSFDANSQLELAQKIQQQQLDFRKTANAPIAQSMKAGIPTLQSRYKQILDDLTFRESEETAKVSRRVSQEYGRRGIPLSSDIYARSSEEELQPTKRFYTGERSNVGITEQEKLDQINQAIATLEAGSPAESIPQGIGLYGNVSNVLESAEQRRIQQEQFAKQQKQAMEIAEMQNKPKAESSYIKLGEGETLFNLNTLQNIFKAPKTYKGTEGGGDYNQYYDNSTNTGRYSLIG